jgi:hypothetical protein
LGRIAVNVIGNPRRSGSSRTGVESIFRETVLLPQVGEQDLTFLLVDFRNAPSLLPPYISSHAFEPLHRFS